MCESTLKFCHILKLKIGEISQFHGVGTEKRQVLKRLNKKSIDNFEIYIYYMSRIINWHERDFRKSKIKVLKNKKYHP